MIKIGHRGACGYEPENTLASFKKAIALGVDIIETDVYKCSTGELVVMHDNKVDRTTNGHGYVFEMSFEALKKLHEKKNQKVPLLREVFDLVDKKCIIDIELKGETTAKAVNKLIEEYVETKGWSYDHFMVSSFNHYELREFNKINSNVKIGALTDSIPIGLSKFAEDLHAYSINPSVEFINQKFVDDAHKRNLKVFVWTVNDFDDIQRMKKLGVDGMFSNYPDRI